MVIIPKLPLNEENGHDEGNIYSEFIKKITLKLSKKQRVKGNFKIVIQKEPNIF